MKAKCKNCGRAFDNGIERYTYPLVDNCADLRPEDIPKMPPIYCDDCEKEYARLRKRYVKQCVDYRAAAEYAFFRFGKRRRGDD